MTYSYDPAKLAEHGKDLMRFELGDTEVEDKEDTCALSDEEYTGILELYANHRKPWKRAKLACIESIFRRFSYEPDTVDGPVSFKFGDRAKLWQDEYKRLKKELEDEDIDASAILGAVSQKGRPPYFYLGMMNREKEGV